MYTDIGGFISKAECNDIIALAKSLEEVPSKYVTNHCIINGELVLEDHYDEKICKSSYFQLPNDHPINDKIWVIGSEFAKQHKIDVNIFTWSACVKYTAGCHFTWHVDAFNETDKLSCGIQLSDSNDYEGGELQFGEDLEGHSQTTSQDIYKDWELTQKSVTPVYTASKVLGTVSLYHSAMYHRVTPVISGCRWALLSWFRYCEDGNDPYYAGENESSDKITWSDG